MEEAQIRDDEMGAMEEETKKMATDTFDAFPQEYSPSSATKEPSLTTKEPTPYSPPVDTKEPPYADIAEAIDNFLTLENNVEENMLAMDMSQSMSDDDDDGGLPCFESSVFGGKLRIDEATPSSQAPKDDPAGAAQETSFESQTSKAYDSSSSRETLELEEEERDPVSGGETFKDLNGGVGLSPPEEVDVDSKEGLDQLYRQRSMVKQALLDELQLLDSKQEESEQQESERQRKEEANSSSEEEATSAPGKNSLQQQLRPKEETEDTEEEEMEVGATAEGDKEGEKRRDESMEEGEEGELEEGELEDEMEEGHEAEGSGATEKKLEKKTVEVKKESKDTEKPVKAKESKDPEKNNKIENLERKGKADLKKRKHKEKNDPKDASKLKKRKHNFSAEDETEVPRKGPPREKSLDFDTLLKQRQMFLVGGPGPNPENQLPQEDPFEHNQYRDVDSLESGSGGDEWGDGPKPQRRRAPRKRRGGSRSPSRKGEAICMFYLQGSCKRGGDCPYSHDISPPRKMELCKFYMMDCCAKKEKCLYMHKDFPCKYYHFGLKCKDGDLCKFSHDPLQEITKNILLKHIELAPKDILGDFPRLSKHSSQIILFVTEAKRNGDPIDDDHLESVMDYEGKGFRYLDRALKNGRKKKDGERGKSGDKEKEEGNLKGKEKDEKDSKERDRLKEVAMKIREIRENKEREKSPKKVKSYDKDDHREREKDKKERNKDRENRHRERDNGVGDKGGRNREKGRRERIRPDGIRSSTKPEPLSEQIAMKQKDPFSEMTPKQKELFHRLEDRRPQAPDYEGRLSMMDQSLSSIRASYHMGGDSNYPPTRWYSSDEEAEGSRSSEGRKESYGSPPGGRRQQLMGDSWGRGGSQEKNIPPVQNQLLQTNFLDQSNLSNIDVSYLKNVLNTVQSQTSQKNNLQSTQDSRADSWSSDRRPSSSGFSPRERSRSNNYLDMANDIREVFYEPPETNNTRPAATNIDSFLHNARQMSAMSSNLSDRDISDDTLWGDGGVDRDIPDPRLKGTNGLTRGRPLQEVVVLDNNKGSFDQNSPFSTNPKNSRDYDESPAKEKDLTEKKDSDLRPANSIYYIGGDSHAPSLSPECDEGPNALPFKVPVHSAKEIDGSINIHSPITYRLVLVTVPKPDFSKLRINRSDPKTLEDPRLKRMLRRGSTEEGLKSPRGAPGVEGVQSIGSPPFDAKAKLSSKIAEIESRDPRKSISRDPRTEPRGDPRVDPTRTDSSWPDSRTDPRLDSRNTPSDPRSDPRSEWVDPRIDPRMSQRNDPRSQGCRMDPRDSVMGSDIRESDPRVGGPVFSNGLIEGIGYGGFPVLGNMSSPLLPPGGIDPRGRPGLLGAGPSPNSLQLGQLPQSLNHSAFLLQSPIGHQGGHFMTRDRGDMIGGPGPNFSQGWGMGRPPQFNDPRLSSGGDFSPLS